MNIETLLISLIIGKMKKHIDTSAFPFSYIIDSKGEYSIMPGMNITSVGVYRDSKKWRQRDGRENSDKLDNICFDFLNPYKIEPTLDVKSEVKVRKWTIYLEITGTPEKLNFKLSSNPEETEGDIISLLVLGRTTGELIAGEGGTAQSTQQLLAEMISTTFGEDIKQATGLDILEVGNGGEDEEGSPDRVKVTVGKTLSKRMTVKYAIDSKSGEMVQRAIAEYKFLENILLSGFQDSRGIFGGALQFRLEFR